MSVDDYDGIVGMIRHNHCTSYELVFGLVGSIKRSDCQIFWLAFELRGINRNWLHTFIC